MAYGKAAHHRGDHDRLAAIVVAHANANPDHRCDAIINGHVCGLTLTEGITRWGRNGRWEAGHRIDGAIATSTADYTAQHARCNRSMGATVGNRNRHGNSLGL